MKIRFGMFSLLFLLLLPLVFAQTVSLDPVEVYEGSLRDYNLSVNNYDGPFVITNIGVELPGFSDFTPVDYLGWNEGVGSTGLSWQEGDLETNIYTALFGFAARAPVVAANSTVNVSVVVENLTNYTEVILPVLIVEDLSAPLLSAPVPVSGGLMLAGIPAFDVSILAVDGESGMDEVLFSHAVCDESLVDYPLDANGSNYSSTLSFAQYNTSVTACFEFRATNNAGLISTYSGNVTFDATPPTVTLLSPADSASSGVLTTFSYSASDDLAQTLSCELLVDDNSVATTLVNNTETAVVVANLSFLADGTYDWEVECADSVGLTSSASRSLVVDATPPTITLNSPLNGSLIGPTTIDYTVYDANGVAITTTSHDPDTSGWSEGLNVFEVNATDFAGNFNSAQFTFTVDRTAPVVSLLGPASGTQADTYVNVSFTVTDTFDSVLDCTIDTDAGVTESVAAASGSNVTTQLTLPRGNITWSVSCADDVNNTGSSSSLFVEILDMTGPSLSSSFSAAQRGVDNTVPATASDPSGVDTVTFSFEGKTIALSHDVDDAYSGLLSIAANHSLGNFTGTLSANDTNGFSTSVDLDFSIVPAYFITIDADDEFDIGEQVAFIVEVTNDLGENLSDTYVHLETPYYYLNNVSLNNVNKFSDNFGVASDPATYTLTAKYTANGFVYTNVHVFGVGQPAGGSSNGGNGPNTQSSAGSSSGGSSNSPNSQADTTNTEESVTNTQSNDPNSEGTGGENSESEDPAEPESERQPLGVGQASGLFNLGDLSPLWWVLIALLGLLLALFIASKYRNATKLPEPLHNGSDEKPDIDWDEYFGRHNK